MYIKYIEPHQSIFSTSFLVVWVTGSLFSGDIDQTGKFVSVYVMGTSVSKKNLKKEMKNEVCHMAGEETILEIRLNKTKTG